jgi:hypothetical protein
MLLGMPNGLMLTALKLSLGAGQEREVPAFERVGPAAAGPVRSFTARCKMEVTRVVAFVALIGQALVNASIHGGSQFASHVDVFHPCKSAVSKLRQRQRRSQQRSARLAR